MVKLTAKQEMFCKEYLVDLNATQAAIRAGYSEKTAYAIGHENLSKPDIQENLSKLVKTRMDKFEINADKVLNEISNIAFSDLTDIVGLSNGVISVKDFNELTKEQRACISSAEQDKDGMIKIKLYDKLSALEKLGKHLKLFTDKIQLEGDINIIYADKDDENV